MALKFSRLRGQCYTGATRRRCQFLVQRGKGQPGSLRQLQIKSIVDGQFVAIGEFDRLPQSGRSFGVVDKLQVLKERQRD